MYVSHAFHTAKTYLKLAIVSASSGSGGRGSLKDSCDRYARRSRLIGFSGSEATYSRMMRRSSSARSRIPILSGGFHDDRSEEALPRSFPARFRSAPHSGYTLNAGQQRSGRVGTRKWQVVVSVAKAGQLSQLTTWCYPTTAPFYGIASEGQPEGRGRRKKCMTSFASSQLSVELRRRPGTGHAACTCSVHPGTPSPKMECVKLQQV